MLQRTLRCTAAAVACVAGACAPAPAPATPSFGARAVPASWPYPLDAAVATGTRAMVASDAPHATRVGLDVLRAGGNAVDAAIATAFALAVVYPEAGNIGGGGFMVAHMADGTRAALDFREKAPLAATRDMYLDARGEPTDRSLTGHLAAGVPGSVAGLWEAHRRFGTRPWEELIAPAIGLARFGFQVDDAFTASVAGAAERLRRFDASALLFLPNGEPTRAGSRWRNVDLSVVLQRIAERGPAGFYEGETADLIVREMQRGGGLITHDDLRRYRPAWREPVVFDYHGHTIVSMPPASSGGLTLALIAGILEPMPLRGERWHSPAALHLSAEAMRRAFADRNHFLGDPDFVSIPRARLLAAAYHDSLRASIDRRRATPSASVQPGGGRTLEESDHTTHFSIVDAQGNAVALTTTINELYGSAVTVAGAGFLLNDEMDDFTSKPGAPNLYGLVQGAANAIAPEKRMLSAMTPTIVLAPDGRPLLVTGARGGPRIITAVFQVIANVVDHGMALGEAVSAPRIHHQHLPDVLYYERDGLTPEQVAALEALGHTVEPRGGYIGSAPSILRAVGGWHGFADPRTGGRAEGY
jgi:gamma-glutamyltranspeptidase/glutathione hydrolase